MTLQLKHDRRGPAWNVWALTEPVDDPALSSESFIVGTGVTRVEAMHHAIQTFRAAIVALRVEPLGNTIDVTPQTLHPAPAVDGAR